MNTFEKYRKYFLIEGILFLILGILAIALPQITTLAIELFIGWILLIGGVVQFVRTVASRGSSGYWPSLVGSIFTIVIGFLLIAYPLTGIITLTLLLTIFFFIDGISKIAFALRHREVARWGWLLVSGIISFLLAFIILSGWPLTATWVIGLLVGINMLFLGITLLALTAKTPDTKL